MREKSESTVEIRVRYAECDPMGLVHHAVYPIWLELARTELLRQSGLSYAQLEQQGLFIVVVKLNLSYHKPARYDDQLTVHAALTKTTPAKILHDYTITRNTDLILTASTTLACLDPTGKPTRVPQLIRLDQ